MIENRCLNVAFPWLVANFYGCPKSKIDVLEFFHHKINPTQNEKRILLSIEKNYQINLISYVVDYHSILSMFIFVTFPMNKICFLWLLFPLLFNENIGRKDIQLFLGQNSLMVRRDGPIKSSEKLAALLHLNIVLKKTRTKVVHKNVSYGWKR